MKRIVLLALLASAFLAGVSAEPRRYLGYPKIVRGVQNRFYVWGNDNGRFNIRVTSNTRNTIMKGLIIARGGKFTDVRLIRREPGDILRVSENGKYLYFRYRVSRGIDGFDFLTDATSLVVRFDIGRAKARPRLIHLGRLGISPRRNPFIVGITDDETGNIEEFLFDPNETTIDIINEIPESELDEASR